MMGDTERRHYSIPKMLASRLKVTSYPPSQQEHKFHWRQVLSSSNVPAKVSLLRNNQCTIPLEIIHSVPTTV